jgi:hypothetical protein
VDADGDQVRISGVAVDFVPAGEGLDTYRAPEATHALPDFRRAARASGGAAAVPISSPSPSPQVAGAAQQRASQQWGPACPSIKALGRASVNIAAAQPTRAGPAAWGQARAGGRRPGQASIGWDPSGAGRRAHRSGVAPLSASAWHGREESSAPGHRHRMPRSPRSASFAPPATPPIRLRRLSISARPSPHGSCAARRRTGRGRTRTG